jgi:hypothetical protein
MTARGAWLILPSLLVACGDRTNERAVRAMPAAESLTVARDAVRLAGPAETGAVPVALATACIDDDPAVDAPWTLRQVDASLEQLALVAIESLASRDSAGFAARIARAVDVLPSDTSEADFRGLPVAVRAAWRFAPAPGDTIVAALVARRLPMESNPLEELFFLVASPGQRQGVRDPLVEGWVVREVATEESIAVRELLGAYRSGDAISLVIAHDAGAGVRAELLSRRASKWSVE